MFKLDPNPTFWAKVKLSIPGEAAQAEVEVEYKHFGREALMAYYASIAARPDAEALGEIMVSWRGFDSGYSQDALRRLTDNYPASAGELLVAFRTEMLESKTKN